MDRGVLAVQFTWEFEVGILSNHDQGMGTLKTEYSASAFMSVMLLSINLSQQI